MAIIEGTIEGGYTVPNMYYYSVPNSQHITVPNTFRIPSFHTPRTLIYSNGTESISVVVHDDNTVHIDVDALDFLLKAAGFDPSSYTEREAEAA